MNTMEMVMTEAGLRCITSSKFRSTDFWEFREMGTCQMKGFELGGGLEINFKRGNDVQGEGGIDTCINGIPGTANSIWVKQRIGMFEGCT